MALALSSTSSDDFRILVSEDPGAIPGRLLGALHHRGFCILGYRQLRAPPSPITPPPKSPVFAHIKRVFFRLALRPNTARGTVLLRMPVHPVALELLRDIGPLAVSSANRHGANLGISPGSAGPGPADRLILALAAVHAARSGAIRALQLEDGVSATGA